MKIAIIGAGVCGLYLAKNLAGQKHEVVVFEKKSTIGKQCCSGLFSNRIFDFIPEARGLALNQINFCLINFPKKTINLKFNRPFFVIEHAQVDLLAAALAVQAGAQIRVGEKINAGRLRQMESEYDRIIGSDGALSPTRDYVFRKGLILSQKGLDPFSPKPEFWLGIQGFEKKPDHADFVETWATKNGFLWKIPRGEDIEWGIMEKPACAPKIFNEFISQKNLKLHDLKSAIIPQGLVLPPEKASLAKGGPKNEKITLCGDASGLTKPWSGGGVVWNLTQSSILLQNFPNFLQYKKEAERFFNLRLAWGNFAKKCAYGAGFKFPWLIPGKIALDSDFLINFFKK